MRMFRQSIRHLRHSFLVALNPDIYISTWDIVGHSKYKFSRGTEQEERLTEEMVRAVYGARLRGSLVRGFDPEAVTPQWIRDIPTQPWLQRRITSMYYHVWEANRLKRESGVRYDVTIRCRPDLFFSTGLAAMISQAAYSPSRVFTPEAESYGFTNDQFMFGSSGVMDRVASLYEEIGIQQEWWNPETAEKTLADYLAVQGIEVVRLPIKYVRGS